MAGVLLSTPFKFEGLGRSFGWDDRSRTFKLDPEYFNYPENKGTNKIEPTQEEVIKRDMIYVYLFYELAHFYHYVSGRWSYHIGINEESNATGLYEFTNVEYSENAFRKQLQLKRRPCYAFRTGIMKWPGSPEYYEDERKKRATRGLPEQKLITLESEECQHGYNWNKETFPVGPARLAGPIRHIPARSHPRRRP